ncbi:RsmG family class I SAM-dependent methyltransferase, partial [Lactobacillus taiwanensis]
MNPEIFAKELAKYGFELSDNQKGQFATYYNKLIEFNKKVNLTRITDEDEVYLKHFFDSITPLL